MAKAGKNIHSGERVNNSAALPTSTAKRKIELAFGLFFLFSGIFLTVSVFSYFFSWQVDQDKLRMAGSLPSYVFHGPLPENAGGRLGAALSHLLVFDGVGIAASLPGLWLAAFGWRFVARQKVRPLMKYLRWLTVLVLILAPTLTFLFPSAEFPVGGAWGNLAIDYLNGFMGKIGTFLVLLSTALFFLMVFFTLDIRPLLRKAQKRSRNMGRDILKNAMPLPQGMLAGDMDIQKEEIPERQNPLESMAEPVSNRKIVFDLAEKPEPVKSQETAVHTGGAGNGVDEPELSISDPVVREEKQVPQSGRISIEDKEPYAPELDLPSYRFPTLDLLEDREESYTIDKDELQKNKSQIIQTLRSFGIEIQNISATIGPTVTLYEIVPAEGVRISKIRNLEDDIALNLAALGIRIIAPIPGKGTIGIEVPNAHKQIVSMRALMSSDKFIHSKMTLPIALGKKIDNENYIVDLATMPHLLLAGATGQGKSVGINAILVSLLYKKHPAQLKFVMVDPKKVELSVYQRIEKHFLAKLPNEVDAIITDNKKVINTLNALCIEMNNRYELLKDAGTRNIREYNEKFIRRRLNPESGHKYLPFIVLVIDEFADLIMTAGKEVEMPIARLAQLARAVGIHLIIATQRPSVNVITGTIKANFPGRIAFKVSAKVDSRTILDTGGAEQLIGRGDMLVSHGSELLRLQCAFVDTPEVEKIVDFIGDQRGYPTAFELPEYEGEEETGTGKTVDLTDRDRLFENCARVVVQMQSGSTSMLQRRFNLGYNRAGRIMDQLEAAGIVGAAIGSKPREVFVYTESELDEILQTL